MTNGTNSVASSRTVSNSSSTTSTASTTVIDSSNSKILAAAVVAGIANGDDMSKEAQNNSKHLKQIIVNGCVSANGITANGVKSAIVQHLDDLDDDDDELDFEDLDNDALSSDNDGKTDTPSLSSSGSSHTGGDSGSTLSETPSGKSSPSAFPDPLTTVNNVITTGSPTAASITSNSSVEESAITTAPSCTQAITNGISSSSCNFNTSSSSSLSSSGVVSTSDDKSGNSTDPAISSSSSSLFGSAEDGVNLTTTTVTTSTANKQQSPPNGLNKLDNATSRFSKLSIFDDNSSFFSHSTLDPYNYNKLESGKFLQSLYWILNNSLSSFVFTVVNSNLENNQPTGITSSQLPDLLSGTNDTNEQHTKEILKSLGNIQQQQQQHHLLNNLHLQQQLSGLGLGNGGVESLAGLGTGNTDDWDTAFSKYVMRNKLDVEHHEEHLRITQELQKRNLINSGLNGTQFNGFNGWFIIRSWSKLTIPQKQLLCVFR